MQYIYNKEASKQTLILKDDLYKYVVKVKRYQIGEDLFLRNLLDDILYTYKIENITKKELFLKLSEKKLKKVFLQKDLELFWCVIDPKTIEKTLPFLNQIGVKKIVFVYCQRSQKNFKLDFERFKKIVINSNQQCGRVHIMEFELQERLENIIQDHQDVVVLDFGGEDISKDIKKVLIGCEGGFTKSERELLKNQKKVAFSTQNILKSETAAVAIASKLLI